MTAAALTASRFRPAPAVWVSIAAVAASLAIGALLVGLTGVSVPDAVAAFADGAWGSPYAIGASVNRALAFALVGVGFVFAQRANLTNVGGEGQIAVGGMAAAAVALHAGVAAWPLGLAWIVPLLAATAAGALWGAFPGWLKARAGTNEVISTLLLSFIAVWMLYGSVQSEALLRQPMTSSSTLPESLPIPDPAQLPLLAPDSGLPLHVGLPIGLALAVAVGIVMSRTVFGVRLRAVGLNPEAAKRAGIRITASIVAVMAAAGALGGLAGGLMLLGEQYVLKAGFSSGYGFDGLVAGLLARGSIVGVLAAALLFGFLRSGGINMEMVAGVPSALVVVIQGLIIVTLAGAALFIDRRSARA
jgi:simple sugar transport system permease protein